MTNDGANMITRLYEKIVFVCDGCEGDLPTNAATWEAARAVFKRERWRDERLSNGSYEHYCPECA